MVVHLECNSEMTLNLIEQTTNKIEKVQLKKKKLIQNKVITPNENCMFILTVMLLGQSGPEVLLTTTGYFVENKGGVHEKPI